MITDFCAVLLYLPTRDEWIEIVYLKVAAGSVEYLPTRDEWIEIHTVQCIFHTKDLRISLHGMSGLK